MDQGLGRGVNFGNALDALGGGPELPLDERWFDVVATAGFGTVRLPVRWSAHAAATPPYAIDPAFFRRVDAAVRAALDRGLNAVVNVHHYDGLSAAPDEHLPRFLALWRQIAAHYADHAEQVSFELLNEPNGRLTASRWNIVLAQALAVVRESNPERTVLIGPTERNDPRALPALAVPDDGHLLATVHYYAPFEFTHQGAGWIEGAEHWLGRTWGDAADERAVRDDLAEVAAWGREHGLPVFVGEFGAFAGAAMDSRERWTAFVRSEAERLGMSWAYWEFGTDFGAFDVERGAWREPLLRALLGGGPAA
ncbi:glycoside hydrolase family 5 protein [Streptomyces cocklensis]|jgi:endoglucanase|uniref:Endoglucanase H n=1 Tax=Actinacidiphila cocklensis TaxID=887465 RepID=A0A9W4GXN2_9ACTN|nr:glycoside hydrolase family 5 protein [Actinacidiphila cocklensis]MDD1058812.1 glycoside hydrolase family 5 protein [Actinacidiphila cocklensis]CAG6398935.1 Endoglucanase H [Actinacidiphila cocklensis]